MAVRCNAVGTVKALLAAKANVLAPSGNGKTALEVASMQPNAAGLVRTVMDTQT
jgi:ankyrin repeat protein